MSDNDRAATGRKQTAGRGIRVVIADDHSVVRRGPRRVLETQGEVEVVAEGSDIAGARRYLEHRPLSTP